MTVENFKNVVSSGDRLFVKFGASWCAPCKVLDKEIEQLLIEHPEVADRIMKIDIDEAPELAEELNIQSTPICAFIANGEYVLRSGLHSRYGIFEWVKKSSEI